MGPILDSNGGFRAKRPLYLKIILNIKNAELISIPRKYLRFFISLFYYSPKGGKKMHPLA